MAKRTWFTAAGGADATADIAIYDEIGGWGVSARDFRDALTALGPLDTINLSLNSPGGDVFDGIAIHNLLASNPAKVNITVDGIAASIASLIAMAGDRITMPDNAMMMVHNPAGMVMGTASDMQGMAEALGKIKGAMVGTYAARTGQTPEVISGLMDATTWLTAAEAKENGFADAVSPAAKIAARFDLSRFSPPENIVAAYDPDGDGDDDALEAVGYIGQAIDNLTDAVGALTGVGDSDGAAEANQMLARLDGLRAGLRSTQLPRAAAPNWTVGAARDLPIDEADSWTGAEAAERVFDMAGFNGDTPDPAKARRGFLVYDSTAPKLKGSYRLPFADVIGGELRAMVGGLNAAASRLPQTDIPDDVQTRARAVIDSYQERRKKQQQGDAMASASAAALAAANEIASLCTIAGMPERIAGYLQANKAPAEVRAELQSLRADQTRDARAAQLSARHDPLAGHEEATRAWGKALARINARHG